MWEPIWASRFSYWLLTETCIGHVYIVLEPVGSAHLTFGDHRYYEFMCFDVPKVVRSPAWDHGHEEESRNGRDIKIHILEVSRPICDPIHEELEGPTKDRPAYWNAFARWISLHQHYIIDGDTYIRHTMPHEYNITIHQSIIRLRMNHKQKLKRHPPC